MLPDSQGLDTLVRVHAHAPEVPIVVLISLDDEQVGIEAMRQGAQDYLVKDQVDAHLLMRAMHYALERHRWLLAEIRQREQLERELRSLEQLVVAPPTAVTAQMFGAAPLRELLPAMFDQLAQDYGTLLDLALEQRVYKVEHNITEQLRTMAQRMGFLRAGPRDVVEVHTAALKARLRNAPPQKAQAYIEEGRLMVLELMGYLVAFYRVLAAGAKPASSE